MGHPDSFHVAVVKLSTSTTMKKRSYYSKKDDLVIVEIDNDHFKIKRNEDVVETMLNKDLVLDSKPTAQFAKIFTIAVAPSESNRRSINGLEQISIEIGNGGNLTEAYNIVQKYIRSAEKKNKVSSRGMLCSGKGSNSLSLSLAKNIMGDFPSPSRRPSSQNQSRILEASSLSRPSSSLSRPSSSMSQSRENHELKEGPLMSIVHSTQSHTPSRKKTMEHEKNNSRSTQKKDNTLTDQHPSNCVTVPDSPPPTPQQCRKKSRSFTEERNANDSDIVSGSFHGGLDHGRGNNASAVLDRACDCEEFSNNNANANVSSSPPTLNKLLNTPVHSPPAPSSQFGHRELRNTINSCFINATIQALFSFPRFVFRVLYSKAPGGQKLPPYCRRLKEIFSVMRNRKGRVEPHVLRKFREDLAAINPDFNTGGQQDAHQFFMEFINAIAEAFNGKSSDSNKENISASNPITPQKPPESCTSATNPVKPLEFILEKVIGCDDCHARAKRWDPCIELQVGLGDYVDENIQSDIQKLIEIELYRSKVDSKCAKCGSKNGFVSTAFDTKHLPEFLVISIKRYSWESNYYCKKRTETVKINRELLLNSLLSNSSMKITECEFRPEAKSSSDLANPSTLSEALSSLLNSSRDEKSTTEAPATPVPPLKPANRGLILSSSPAKCCGGDPNLMEDNDETMEVEVARDVDISGSDDCASMMGDDLDDSLMLGDSNAGFAVVPSSDINGNEEEMGVLDGIEYDPDQEFAEMIGDSDHQFNNCVLPEQQPSTRSASDGNEQIQSLSRTTSAMSITQDDELQIVHEDIPNRKEILTPWKPISVLERMQILEELGLPDVSEEVLTRAHSLLPEPCMMKSGNPIHTEVDGDGSCFFRCLSWWIYGGDEENHNILRQTIANFIAQFTEDFQEMNSGYNISIETHISLLKDDSTWANEVDIFAAATLLKCTIYSYHRNRWTSFRPRFNYKVTNKNLGIFEKLQNYKHGDTIASRGAIYILNKSGVHFDPVIKPRTTVQVTDQDFEMAMESPSPIKEKSKIYDRELSPAPPPEEPFFYKEEDGIVFTLVAVICHQGLSPNYGHYTAYTFDKAYGCWLYCSDEHVYKVDESTVLKAASKEGYILAYRKRTEKENDQFLLA